MSEQNNYVYFNQNLILYLYDNYLLSFKKGLQIERWLWHYN